MSAFVLAQLNIAALKAPLDSPALAGFVTSLERINALADRAPGFVWRLQSEAGDATAIRPMGENTLVNLSVWRDVESLRDFVYRSAHLEVMRGRGAWFEPMRDAFIVLWWIPRAHRPTTEEAIARLGLLRSHGASAEAFTFRTPYPAPDAAQSPSAER